MIPKTDGDATPLGQRPLSVLPVVYRIWAAVRMGQLEGWFKSWVPDSVFSAGGGRGSVEAWKKLLLWILRKFFQVLLIPMSTFLLLMSLSPLILLIVVSWIGCCLVLGFLVGFVMLILSTMLMSGFVSSLLLALDSPGLVMVAFLRDVP